MAREQATADSITTLIAYWKDSIAAADAALIEELQAAEARRQDSLIALSAIKSAKPNIKKSNKNNNHHNQNNHTNGSDHVLNSLPPNDYSTSTPPVKAEEVKPEAIAVPSLPLKNYNVVLTVDSSFKTHEIGELRVWIGAKGTVVKVSQGQVQDSVIIPARLGQSAKVTPFAPGFTVAPAETQCMKIDSSGSEVRFQLTPNGAGTWKVSADIKLYDMPDCNGTPVPKPAATLTVIVEVDHKREAGSKLSELGAVVWDKFMGFWGAVVTLIFGSLLYVFRNKLKSRTGFDDKAQ